MIYDVLDVDTLLQVLSFVNAQGLARLAAGSRLGVVVSHEAQQHPALLVLKGTPEEVARGLRERLAARPTVAFLQYKQPHMATSESTEMAILQFVRDCLPPETEVIGARTESLQCLWNPDVRVAQSGSAAQSGTVLDVCSDCDDNGHIGVLLATLPEARSRALCLPFIDDSPEWSSEEEDEEDYSSEEDVLPPVVVGSESEAGAAAQAPEDLDGDEEAAQAPKEEKAGGNQKVRTEELAASGGNLDPMAELLSLDPPPKVIAIQYGSGTRSLLDRLQDKYPQAAIIGGCVMGRQVMARSQGVTSSSKGVGVLAISGNVPVFAMTCPKARSAAQAQEDVRRKMRLAQEKAIAEDQKILGALLFTCIARDSRTFGRDGNDAFLFKERFPQAPLLGYYAGGEIGPEVTSAAQEESAFLAGNAAFQGFTAVFGIFLVPRKQAPSNLFQRAVLYGEVQEAFQEVQASRRRV